MAGCADVLIVVVLSAVGVKPSLPKPSRDASNIFKSKPVLNKTGYSKAIKTAKRSKLKPYGKLDLLQEMNSEPMAIHKVSMKSKYVSRIT